MAQQVWADYQYKILHRSNIVESSATSPYELIRRSSPSPTQCHGDVPSNQCNIQKEKRMRNLSFVKRITALAMALMFLVAANVTRVEAAPGS